MKTKRNNAFTLAMFIIYALLLFWMIVFKFQFSIEGLIGERVVNLIPFERTAKLYEVVMNIICFIPFGIYISMLRPKWGFFIKALVICCTSIVLEVIQYALAIGRADITDVINNTIGGAAGLIIFLFTRLILKEKTGAVVNAVMLIVTIVSVTAVILVLSGTLLRFRV